MNCMPKHYDFVPRNFPLLTNSVARKIIKSSKMGEEEVLVSLDLGKSLTKVYPRGNVVFFGRASIPAKELEKVEEGDVFLVESQKIKKVAFFADGKFYRLVDVGEGCAPTLEISGIHMHRKIGTTPWEDSKEKVKAARIFSGARVLDICTGLGYTAILSMHRRASVTTVEKMQMY